MSPKREGERKKKTIQICANASSFYNERADKFSDYSEYKNLVFITRDQSKNKLEFWNLIKSNVQLVIRYTKACDPLRRTMNGRQCALLIEQLFPFSKNFSLMPKTANYMLSSNDILLTTEENHNLRQFFKF